jgi:hypothetical protein
MKPLKNLKNLVLGTIAAVALYTAPGCSVQRHYVIDNFDDRYGCEIQFSEDLKSDEITLYESGEKVATRTHSVNDQLEHKFLYEFFQDDVKLGEAVSSRKWRMVRVFESAEEAFDAISKMRIHFYEMEQCEKLLEEKNK